MVTGLRDWVIRWIDEGSCGARVESEGPFYCGLDYLWESLVT